MGKFIILLILSLLVFPTTIKAKTVYTDSTGYEVWYISTHEMPYYTTNPFSPNGKYIVYGGCQMINTDGSNEHNLSGSCSQGVGEYGVMGWWSNDSRHYFLPQGLYKIDVNANTVSQIPNASQYLPFYFPQVSPDGKTLFGLGNANDSSSAGTAKFVNIDGTNYRTFTSPGRSSGGFDVTHGWLGNGEAWYLNNSQFDLYADVAMVFNVTSGAFKGPLNVGSQTWSGVFTHPMFTNLGTMVGGGQGLIGGNGQTLQVANTKATTDASQREKRTVASVGSDHQNFSQDGKWITVDKSSGSDDGYIVVYPVPPVGSSNPAGIRVAQHGSAESNSNFSPDSTKIGFTSNVSGRSGLNMAIFKKPAAPTAVTAATSGSQIALTWKPAAQHRETKEYEIHASSSQTGTYTKVATIPEVYTYLEAPSKISASDTTLTVDSTAGFPDTGVVEILGLSTELPTELVRYTGRTATQFTGCTRGYGGTTAAEHYNDAFVWKSTASVPSFVPASGSWFKVRSVEWSGVLGDFSAAVSVNGTVPTNPPTNPPAGKPGDINSDNKVDIVDIGILIDVYGMSPSVNPKADINKDGKIDIVDVGIVVDNYGI